MNLLGILFDYGGTLDSRGDHWSEVMWRAYTDTHAGVDRADFREAYIHAERALDGSGMILPSDTFLAVMRKKTALQLEHLHIHDTALAEAIAMRCYESARHCVAESAVTLRALARRDRLGIVSNFYGNIRAVLDDFGLLPLMSAVIDSTEAGIRKPDPALFSLGLRALGIDDPARVLVVGDSIDKDILPARTLGCRTALVSGLPWDATMPGYAPAHTVSPPPDTIILPDIASILKVEGVI